MCAMNRLARTALLGILAVLVTVPALAQGLYYKEILKDGRYYVFNNARNAELFETGGEMGVAITLPGAGPDGATVIGDSERALQLFFFKHGIAYAVPDPPPPPPPAGPFRLTGLVFGDYYGFASNHLPAFEDQHGLWLRRGYFTFDYTHNPRVSSRLRFEMNSNGKLAGGALTPYVKDAYVRWNFHGRQNLMLGIQPSLTFEFVESIWGLRHIEKTPLDLYRVDSSRDTGVTLFGPLNETQTMRYAVQFGNESGNNAEADKFKGYRAVVRHETNPGFSVEGMFGHFNRSGDADRTTGQVFLGYRQPNARFGVQYSYQKRQAPSGSPASDVELKVASAFVVAEVKPQKVWAFLRADRVASPCSDCTGIDYLPIASGTPFTFVLAGIEYYLLPNVRFSPNIEFVSYSTPASGQKPKNDAVARLTFYWAW